MKKTIFTMVASALMLGAILTSCSTPAEKLENAQENVAEANEDLEQANQEYLADIEAYRLVTANKIEANNKSIAEFNARIAKDKAAAKSDYNAKIAELEQKNSDMKKKMDDYKAEGKDKWELFKTEFNSDMERLGSAIKDLSVKNTK